MSNFLNNDFPTFEVMLSDSDYWDWVLAKNLGATAIMDGMVDKCLASYIDFSDPRCIVDSGDIVSSPDYVFDGAVSKGVTLNNIGLTGVDNGYITFDKDTITDKEFKELYTDSKMEIEEGDIKLRLHSVAGNNKIYTYNSEVVTDEDGNPEYADLNGGFYQGFFRIGDGCEYNVLPKTIGNGWSMEFEIQPKSKQESNPDDPEPDPEEKTLNDVYPENAGIFFFMGTRAENKWVKYYKDSCTGEEPTKTSEIKTHEGNDVAKANVTEILSDNKFLIFDRGKDGVTIKDYTGNEEALIKYTNTTGEENYFTLFNRSKDGITVKDAEEYTKEHSGGYNYYKDLFNNAIAFQVKDDGSVGYKYFTIDCELEDPKCGYKIESQFSNPGLVKKDEWNVVHVRFVGTPDSKWMRLMFYVNGKICLVSRWLPMFNLRELNDLPDKQEGVAFNISLGGGTQSLCDVIYENYKETPTKIYPFEKEFGGSFVGYFKSFKFYSCQLNFQEIGQNFRFLQSY